MSNVSGPPSEFPQFLRLPAEIRDLIWALCLPYRVREIDQPADCIVFRDRPTPCLLGATTRHNGRAPLISQVCPESRTVALKTRRTETFPSPPDPAYWTSSNWARYVWADSRDAPHLNWRFAYAADFGSYGDNPISRLAWETSRAGGRSGSLMLKFFARGSHYSVKGSQFDDFESIQYRDREILRRFCKWQVVMDVVIIHLDSVQDAVATGLFGLFGEDYVKIIGAADERICDQYYRLAEHASDGQLPKQQHRRKSTGSLSRRCKSA